MKTVPPGPQCVGHALREVSTNRKDRFVAIGMWRATLNCRCALNARCSYLRVTGLLCEISIHTQQIAALPDHKSYAFRRDNLTFVHVVHSTVLPYIACTNMRAKGCTGRDQGRLQRALKYRAMRHEFVEARHRSRAKDRIPMTTVSNAYV